MIVSASYKTDIPAFYADWFVKRLEAGYCMMLNPYSHAFVRVDLSRRSVDGFVFWTKNIRPFLGALELVQEGGFPFVVQYSITGYPKILETSVVDAEQSIANIRNLSQLYGPRVCVWRYDTILFTSITDANWHSQNFAKLADRLQGVTDEVVISFAQIYRKTRLNVDSSSIRNNFQWQDPLDETKQRLASEFAQIASDHRMQLAICSQRMLLSPGIADARCIDATRLSDVAGYQITARQKGNRPDCGCFQSRDIGDYDTCPHGCVYCYAVRNKALAQERYRKHDPCSEFLFPPAKSDGRAIPSDPQLPLL